MRTTGFGDIPPCSGPLGGVAGTIRRLPFLAHASRVQNYDVAVFGLPARRSRCRGYGVPGI